MKQTKRIKYSWLHHLLEAEHDRASSAFCVNWAIEDSDFLGAMLHHFCYLYNTDEFLALYDKLTHEQREEYWNFKNSIRGYK